MIFREEPADGRASVTTSEERVLNQYFADISTDPDYTLSAHSVSHTQNDDDLTGTFSCTCIEIHGYEIEPFLRRVKNSSCCDNVPSWLFNKRSVELADVVAKLLNIIVCKWAGLRQLEDGISYLVTPVPKVTSPASFGDSDPFLSHP